MGRTLGKVGVCVGLALLWHTGYSVSQRELMIKIILYVLYAVVIEVWFFDFRFGLCEIQ